MRLGWRPGASFAAPAFVACAWLGGCRAAEVPPKPATPHIDYFLVAAPGGETIDIQARFPAGSSDVLWLDEEVVPFVTYLEKAPTFVATSTGGRDPRCAQGCTVTYRVRLGEAAAALDHVDTAAREGGLLITSPSAFLLHPSSFPSGTRYRLHVRVPSGTTFVTGLFPAPGEPDVYEAPAPDLAEGPFTAFGAMRTRELAGGKVTLAIGPGLTIPDDAIAQWSENAARAVGTFYGAFPIPHALVLVVPDELGGGIGFGQASGGGGASIIARVGAHAPKSELNDDWVLPHEMVHLAMPYVARRHHWFEEGLATYVEPIARVRAGQAGRDVVWKPFIEMMPKGLPKEGDQGLDRTPTWGRTYWGGAIFCLLADVAIREQTHNGKSLDDGLRAVVAAGGNLSMRWELSHILEVVDGGTGTHVLRELYAKMAEAAAPTDLDALFRRLGVSVEGGKVLYRDDAELAAIRDAITTAPMGKK